MRTRITLVVLFLLSFSIGQLFGQTNDNESLLFKIQELEHKKERVTITERDALKAEVESINDLLENGEITNEKAALLKKGAAEKRAKNIENKLAIIDNTIELIKRTGSSDLNLEVSSLELALGGEDESGDVLFGIKYNSGKQNGIKFDKRTQSNLVIAAGLNNTVGYGKGIWDSRYKLMGSRFFEVGYAWNTRLFKDNNWVRLKYGFSFQFNGLKPKENKAFVTSGSRILSEGNDVFIQSPLYANVFLKDSEELLGYKNDFEKSKLRMDSFIFPFHFEFGPSTKKVNGKYVRYNTENKFKFGIGGYIGVNYKTVNKFKTADNKEPISGISQEELDKLYLESIGTLYSPNSQRTIYGLSTYAGIGDCSLYFKYELTPIFRNTDLKQNNISFGLRFDL